MGVESYSPIRKMDLGLRPGATIVGSSDAQSRMKPNEVGTGDKLVFCALQNGTVEAIDLASKSTILRSSSLRDSTSSSRAPLSAISYSQPAHMVATGSIKGIVTLYDIRSFSRPLFSFRRNEACIEDLRFVPSSSSSLGGEVRLAVATYDGLPFVASVRPEGPLVSEELVGYNCDPCRTIRFVGDSLWVAGDDGAVRKY
jgi:proteasomal ATPase-associated factor 1